MSATPHNAQPSADGSHCVVCEECFPCGWPELQTVDTGTVTLDAPPIEHTTSVAVVRGEGWHAECAGCGWRSQAVLWSHEAQRLGRLHREAMVRARVNDCEDCYAAAVQRGLAA